MAPYELVVDTIDLTPAPDLLLTLDEAADLPRLGGRWDKRALYKAAKRKRFPLRTSKTVREIMTTREWVDAWIEDCTRWVDPVNQPASGSTKGVRPPNGTSSTSSPESASRSALTAARETAAALKASSRGTSRKGTRTPPPPRPRPSGDA